MMASHRPALYTKANPRSQTVFGQYEKLYRRPPTAKKNSKQFKRIQNEEKTKLKNVVDFGNIEANSPEIQSNIELLQSSLKTNRNIYGWKKLGDVDHFEPRGCVGVYWPNSGVIPATATTGTRLYFDVPAVERLDPFGG